MNDYEAILRDVFRLNNDKGLEWLVATWKDLKAGGYTLAELLGDMAEDDIEKGIVGEVDYPPTCWDVEYQYALWKHKEERYAERG